jgi:hypothetical protein
MKNKSQITVFIIIGILLIFIVLGIFVLRDRLIKNNSIDPDVIPVYNLIDSCLGSTSEEAIYHIGQTGGYYISPKQSTDNHVAYYFIYDKSLMPNKEQIQDELSMYIRDMLFFCTRNFVDFADFSIKQGEIKVNSIILKDKVRFDIEYPITISKDNKNVNFNKFSKEIPVRLEVSIEVAKRLIEEQLKTPKDICITCIEELAHDNEIVISAEDYDKESVIFYILDEKSKIKGEDYVFYYANKYLVE